MLRFVFGFVFSTATCFQQLLRFVFRFVPVCFLARSFVFNNLSGLFFKKGILFIFPATPQDIDSNGFSNLWTISSPVRLLILLLNVPPDAIRKTSILA